MTAYPDHRFVVRRTTENDLAGKRSHILEVISPTDDDTRMVSSSSHNLNLEELADLHQVLGQLLADEIHQAVFSKLDEEIAHGEPGDLEEG